MTILGTPYRLSTTSYIWPADVVTNVRQLGPLVDDVELVLFEADGYSNLPDRVVRAELEALAQLHGLTNTVHLGGVWPGGFLLVQGPGCGGCEWQTMILPSP